MPETAVDILARERVHLSESRAALQRMRQHAAGLEAFGGDHVSTEHLKQSLYRRMKALEDDPTVPLFFGRLDYDTSRGAEQDETLYIGRRHVTGEAGGEPLVIDWRAGMSRPFYQARPGQSMGVRLRRRFGFSHGQLTAYEDEELTEAGQAAYSTIMESEIERPRTGPMRDMSPPFSPNRTASCGPDSVSPSASKAPPAPERPPSACTAPPTCFMRSASSWPVPGCSWWDRTTVSCPTSQTCFLLSVRSTQRRPR